MLALCTGWFVYLWGLSAPSLLAGCALSVMMLLACRKSTAGYVVRREDALRRRLGGEMALESLMLAPARQAHFRAGLMLAEKYPFRMDRITDDGLICADDHGSILISCICAAPQGTVGASALLPVLRAAKANKIGRCAVCATAAFSKEAAAFSELSSVPMRLIGRNELLTLAGRLSPATDEQLAELARRKRAMPLHALAASALSSAKAKRYMTVGLTFSCLYIVTGLKWYALPGLLCMALAALCRRRRSESECL